MNFALLSLAASVFLAFAGYLATYLNALALARRKERLELVSKQLNEFYGPLYLSCKASEIAYHAFQLKVRGVAAAEQTMEMSMDTATMKEWRLWVTTVLMPMNQTLEAIVLRGAHLIQEAEVPPCLLRFIAHVAAWKAVLKKWEDSDFTEQFSVIAYPNELVVYAADRYAALKAEQLKLIGRK
ncbi:hypothetical protein [Chitinivorax sp. B]|uniref:hypothetical protein n=1 Tax=Chitinivorax sp. B TaxID=2502235 RepID=UPI0010F68933|nr:hypothetical protein [Chitinivorax sp. B]